jgi:hypothetical protein
MSDPRSESKSPLPIPKTPSAFHPLARNETLSVVAMRVCNPDRSAPRTMQWMSRNSTAAHIAL